MAKKNFPLIILMWFVVFTFFVGLGVCLSPNVTKESMMNILTGKTEPFTTGETPGSEVPQTCPNMLVKRGNQLMLVFGNLPKSETNPIIFNTLEEYSAFIETQRNQGVHCPVLFLQEENNTQGDNVYRLRPTPFDMNGGGNILPVQPTWQGLLERQGQQGQQGPVPPVEIKDASRIGNIFNANMYPGFDSHNTYTGVYTTLDKVHDSTEQNQISDNPMDRNWGGVTFSQDAVDSGKYVENTVGKPVGLLPKVFP